VALDRLRRKYNLPMTTHLPQVAYKETIRKPVSSIHRYKHQSGTRTVWDVYLEIKPLPRGKDLTSVKRLSVAWSKQYIPGVEMGVREYLHGPHFPVVDVAVTLMNGSTTRSIV